MLDSRLARISPIVLALAAGCAPGQAQPLTPGQIPAAFIALTQKPDRTLHMEWDGSVSIGGGGSAASFKATFDLAGDDYAGRITTSSNSFGKPIGDATVEMALVGGQGYQRPAGTAQWQQVSSMPPTVDPFRGLAATDVEYVGQETHAGQPAHHLRIHNLSPLVKALNPGLSDGTIDPTGGTFDQASSTFDVWVDSTGLPLDAAVDVKPAPSAIVFGGFTLNATYKFSNWNAEIYIVAPANGG